jgi:DUF2934 family protein
MSIKRQGRKTATVVKNAASRSKAAQNTPANARTALSEHERRRMVAEAAYYRALRRGFAAGGEVDDWLAAEQEIEQRLSSRASAGDTRERTDGRSSRARPVN